MILIYSTSYRRLNTIHLYKYITKAKEYIMSEVIDSVVRVANDLQNRTCITNNKKIDNIQEKCIAKLNVEIDSNGKFIDGRENIAPIFDINEDTVLMSKRQVKRVSNITYY